MAEFFAITSLLGVLVMFTMAGFGVPYIAGEWLDALLDDRKKRWAIEREHLQEKYALERREMSDRLEQKRKENERPEIEVHATLSLPSPDASENLVRDGQSFLERERLPR